MKYIHQFLKRKVLSVNERSVFQILDAMRLNDKGTTNSFKTTAETPTFSFDKMWVENNNN